jgi:hypothetical protein
VANTTAIHAAITLLATTQSVTTAITNPGFARALSITGAPAGATLTGNVTLTGTDANGEPLAETLALDDANTVPGRRDFLTVTAIDLPIRTTTADTVSVGVATTLFSVAEARVFGRKELADQVNYPDADILNAEAEIREAFAEVCGVPFVPATDIASFSGSGGRTMLLPHMNVQAITAGVIYDADMVASETFDADDLADLAIYGDGRLTRRTKGSWPRGDRNIKLTIVHGYPVCPQEIRRAALKVLVAKLVPSDLGDRATYMSDGNMTFSLSTAGRFGSEYGLPEVDATLARYSHKLPGIA